MKTTNVIDNTDDIIDTRDIIDRIEHLEAATADGEATAEEQAELQALQALADEAEGYMPDWKYGETLIRDSYFEDYARDLAADCGMIPKDVSWPCSCIDWERAARELQQDYTAFDFAGVTYWGR